MDDAREQIEAVLHPGERILWSGRPDPGVIFSRADFFLIPIGLYFTGFSFFWTFGATSGGAPSFFDIFGVVFILIGLYYLVGRFFVKVAGKRRTAYAVTDSRAIVVKGRRTLESPLVGVQKLWTVVRNGRHMSITFGVPQTRGWFGGGFGYGRNVQNAGLDFFNFLYPAPVAFYDVADVDSLDAALSRVTATAASPPNT